MKSNRTIDTLLVISTIGVVATGIMLHLKKHEILIEPRDILKIIHYSLGAIMVLCGYLHYRVRTGILSAMKKSKPMFRAFSLVLLWLIVTLTLTGAWKLFDPVKIPHLGLIHYYMGIAMAVVSVIHLRSALPWLIAKFKK
ncbi:MAG: hypothetical protein ACI4BC_03060 [Muribaculaceae bacterium]